MALPVGTLAPTFTLKSKTITGLEDVSLGSLLVRGPVVLLFFPAAFSGVCTNEMCTVSENFESYTSTGGTVVGISPDSALAQAAWASANNIALLLLSDYKREVITSYDVVLDDFLGMGPSSKRAAFVIDREGIIAYSEETATPGDLPSLEGVLTALKEIA